MFDTQNLNCDQVTFAKIISPGQAFVRYEKISLDDIYIPPMTDNPVRVEGKDPVNVMALVQSFKQGIDYSRMPPTVRRNPRIVDGKHYTWELVTGNHRFEAFLLLGYTEWIFGVYEFAIDGFSYEDSIRTFELMENDHKPQLASSENDVVNTISRLIDYGSKLVDNTEDSIRRYCITYLPNMHGNKRNSIVLKTMRKSGTYQDIVTYTAKDTFNWINSNTDYVVAGNYDNKRDKYGWTVLEGYQYEYIMNATRKYAETGKESYFICHTKAPTEKMDLDAKRINMQKVFQDLEADLVEVIEFYNKNKRFPWNNEGFLPQNKKIGEKSFIPVESIKNGKPKTPTVFNGNHHPVCIDQNLLEPLNIDLEEELLKSVVQ